MYLTKPVKKENSSTIIQQKWAAQRLYNTQDFFFLHSFSSALYIYFFSLRVFLDFFIIIASMSAGDHNSRRKYIRSDDLYMSGPPFLIFPILEIHQHLFNQFLTTSFHGHYHSLLFTITTNDATRFASLTQISQQSLHR